MHNLVLNAVMVAYVKRYRIAGESGEKNSPRIQSLYFKRRKGGAMQQWLDTASP